MHDDIEITTTTRKIKNELSLEESMNTRKI
jgi:hypothetical protein